jgi:hypothetical protein
VVVVLGETERVGPVPICVLFKNQVKVPPGVGELAVSVPVPPEQMVIGAAVIVGPGFTVTVVVAFTVPQFGTVKVTVYVPAANVVGLGIVGFCSVEE